MFIQSFSLSPLISIHVLELTPDTTPSLYHLTFHLFILGFVGGGGLIFPHVSAQPSLPLCCLDQFCFSL